MHQVEKTSFSERIYTSSQQHGQNYIGGKAWELKARLQRILGLGENLLVKFRILDLHILIRGNLRCSV